MLDCEFLIKWEGHRPDNKVKGFFYGLLSFPLVNSTTKSELIPLAVSVVVQLVIPNTMKFLKKYMNFCPLKE